MYFFCELSLNIGVISIEIFLFHSDQRNSFYALDFNPLFYTYIYIYFFSQSNISQIFVLKKII